MLLYLLAVCLICLCLAGVCYITAIAIRNYNDQQIFTKTKPSLPEVPNRKLFSGHMSILLDPRIWKNIKKYHHEFGKTFGAFYMNKPAVSTIDLDLIKRIVIDEPDEHINRFQIVIPVDVISGHNLFFARDDQWRKIRKQIAPAFSTFKIKSPNVIQEVKLSIERFVESLEWRLDEEERKKGCKRDEVFVEIDAEDIFHRYAIDLVFTCFYKQPNIIDYRADKDKWREMIHEGGLKIINPIVLGCAMFPIAKPILEWLFMTTIPQSVMVSDLIKYIKQSAVKNLENRREMKRARDERSNSSPASSENGSRFKHNMIDYVIDRFFEKKLTEKEFIHSSWMLFMAGNQTTGDGLAKIIYHLALHQDVQDKLRASIMVHGEESEYLSWVINETLRLCPPGQAGCGREVTRDIHCDAGVIPAGTFVYTPVHMIHRLKEYWGPDAEEFKPERWAKADTFHPVQYLPFGAGKRYCPGKYFALSEMNMLFNVLLRRFKFEYSPRANHFQVMECFQSPAFIFNVNEFPSFVRYRRLEKVVE